MVATLVTAWALLYVLLLSPHVLNTTEALGGIIAGESRRHNKETLRKLYTSGSRHRHHRLPPPLQQDLKKIYTGGGASSGGGYGSNNNNRRHHRKHEFLVLEPHKRRFRDERLMMMIRGGGQHRPGGLTGGGGGLRSLLQEEDEEQQDYSGGEEMGGGRERILNRLVDTPNTDEEEEYEVRPPEEEMEEREAEDYVLVPLVNLDGEREPGGGTGYRVVNLDRIPRQLVGLSLSMFQQLQNTTWETPVVVTMGNTLQGEFNVAIVTEAPQLRRKAGPYLGEAMGIPADPLDNKNADPFFVESLEASDVLPATARYLTTRDMREPKEGEPLNITISIGNLIGAKKKSVRNCSRIDKEGNIVFNMLISDDDNEGTLVSKNRLKSSLFQAMALPDVMMNATVAPYTTPMMEEKTMVEDSKLKERLDSLIMNYVNKTSDRKSSNPEIYEINVLHSFVDPLTQNNVSLTGDKVKSIDLYISKVNGSNQEPAVMKRTTPAGPEIRASPRQMVLVQEDAPKPSESTVVDFLGDVIRQLKAGQGVQGGERLVLIASPEDDPALVPQDQPVHRLPLRSVHRSALFAATTNLKPSSSST